MLKKSKKVIAIVLVCVLISLTSMCAFATNDDVSVENIVQEVIDSYEMDVTATQLTQDEYIQIWDQYFADHNGVIGLMDRLENDEFVEAITDGNSAIVVTSNNDPAISIYYCFKFYQNAFGETVLTMFVYDPVTDNMLAIMAEKINVNNETESYYEFSEFNAPQTRAFNWQSFLCGLTGTVACGCFSAMLFAFVPASIAVGMSCSAAFAYVCSYA